MQNLIKYTSIFNPHKKYDNEFIHDFIAKVNTYEVLTKDDPIPLSGKTHIEWLIPFQKPLKDSYHSILCAIARKTKVKLMWRAGLSENGLNKVIWVIGEENRAMIFSRLATCFFVGQFEVETYNRVQAIEEVKELGFKSTRMYSSYMFNNQADMLLAYLETKLEDTPWELKLEGYIKDRYKLDYKLYRTDHPEYYQAISNKFYHRRMLL